jgi:hypothetical protein
MKGGFGRLLLNAPNFAISPQMSREKSHQNDKKVIHRIGRLLPKIEFLQILDHQFDAALLTEFKKHL